MNIMFVVITYRIATRKTKLTCEQFKNSHTKNVMRNVSKAFILLSHRKRREIHTLSQQLWSYHCKKLDFFAMAAKKIRI